MKVWPSGIVSSSKAATIIVMSYCFDNADFSRCSSPNKGGLLFFNQFNSVVVGHW